MTAFDTTSRLATFFSAALMVAATGCADPAPQSDTSFATAQSETAQLTGRTARDLLSALQYLADQGDFGDGQIELQVWSDTWQGEAYLSYGLFGSANGGTVELLRCSEPENSVIAYAHLVGCQLYGLDLVRTTYDGLTFDGDRASGAPALAQVLEAVPAALPGITCGGIDGEFEEASAFTCSVHDEAWYEPTDNLGVFDSEGWPTVSISGQLAETVIDVMVQSGEIDHDGDTSDLESLEVGTISCYRAPDVFCELTSDEISYDLFADDVPSVSFTNGFSTQARQASDILFQAMERIADNEGSLVQTDVAGDNDGVAYLVGAFECYSYWGEAPVCAVTPSNQDSQGNN